MVTMSAKPLFRGIPLPISRLVLGTAFFRLAEMAACHQLLDAFVAAGGTLIDSGRVYGDSEAVIGSWLARGGVRERVVLLTKGAHGDCAIPLDGYPEVLRSELDTSLETLGVDSVELYLLHRDNHQLPVGQILEPLHAEVERGRVVADPETYMTSRPGVFAGGDLVRGGGMTVAGSVREGVKAAEAIDRYLRETRGE